VPAGRTASGRRDSTAAGWRRREPEDLLDVEVAQFVLRPLPVLFRGAVAAAAETILGLEPGKEANPVGRNGWGMGSKLLCELLGRRRATGLFLEQASTAPPGFLDDLIRRRVEEPLPEWLLKSDTNPSEAIFTGDESVQNAFDKANELVFVPGDFPVAKVDGHNACAAGPGIGGRDCRGSEILRVEADDVIGLAFPGCQAKAATASISSSDELAS